MEGEVDEVPPNDHRMSYSVYHSLCMHLCLGKSACKNKQHF